ncbi:MAG: DUF1801 domain-containing protein [Bacteroidetes bacterium]|nr:DUF1801 domain-containing protein [Bacteroidota bacterium]MBS1756950.1 DUF1801 domain-containing protein [Bacteroidota bacterium]
MKSLASSTKEYFENLPQERKPAMLALRNCIEKNIPKGFEEQMGYGMPCWVVPHSIYPAGYHCKPALPLPFVSLASQKKFIALYHMGIYADVNLMKWFTSEYPKHSNSKLDMGKSCIRFKKMEDIPLQLIGDLIKKMTVKDWVTLYEKLYKR